MSKSHVVVVGAGAAGMMAALGALREGAGVTVLEKNDAPGRKLSITGKGRCNLTSSLDSIEEFLEHVPGNPRFLYSALDRFSPADCQEFFHGLGVATQEERGKRIFPVSHTAREITSLLAGRIGAEGGALLTRRRVKRIEGAAGAFRILCDGAEAVEGTAVVLTTGGKAYPGTGSTGDGYGIAAAFGHTIVEPLPSLVPLIVAEPWVVQLEGLSLRNVSTTLSFSGKEVEHLFGEMVFTSYGLSGPIILRHSRTAVSLLRSGRAEVRLAINFKPALSPDQLDARLQRDREKYVRRHFINALDDLLPKKLIPVLVERTGIPPRKERGSLTKKEELALRALLTEFPFTVTGHRSFSEAEVTQGGVKVQEIHPGTMESKLAPGLYFAGEVMDVDGYIGGFNLQIAFATGLLAGRSAAGSA